MREFNVIGRVLPEQLYFVDLHPQIAEFVRRIEKRNYFVINRPRPFGKTTLRNFLADHLLHTGEYLPLLLSFEGFGGNPDLSENPFYRMFWEKVLLGFGAFGMTLEWQPEKSSTEAGFFLFQKNTRSLCRAAAPKKIVLLVDEADSIPETVVLSFLRSLRKRYLERDRLPTFHAVALVGVHDIKNLKARYRRESESIGSASPYNIAVEFEMPPLSLENICQYYNWHTQETRQVFDIRVIASVHPVTAGHPWPVSILAKLMVEKIVPNLKQTILPEHAEPAIQNLIHTRNANFDSLFKNARHPDILPLVLDVLTGKRRDFNFQAEPIRLGVIYGVFTNVSGRLAIVNQIYAQVFYLHFREELEGSGIGELVARNHFETRPGRLDFALVLEKFQQFIKAKGAAVVNHPEFKEATVQLLFLSYLDLLVNDRGRTFKEVRSGQGRIDVVCPFDRQKESVELKRWYGTSRYEEGLEQLVRYLDNEGLDHGYLPVFDRRRGGKKSYTTGEHLVEGKRIQARVV